MESTPKRESDLKKYLDTCLLPLGFTHEPRMGGENYVREDGNGRIIKAHCSMRRRTRYAGEVRYSKYAGHTFEISVTTPVKTRFSIANPSGAIKAAAGGINRLFKSSPVQTTGMLEQYEISATEPQWAEMFVQRTGVPEAVMALIPLDQKVMSGFRLTPVGCFFTIRLHIQEITPEKTAVWLQNTLTLLDAAEANPPMTAVEPRWLERQSPAVAAATIIGGLAAFFIGLGLCCSLFLLLVSFYMSQ